MKPRLRFFLFLLPALLVLHCAIRKVETSKTLYEQARIAEEQGHDLQAILYWKALSKKATEEIEAGHYLATNYFLRATANFELGLWDKGFEDLKQTQPELLREEEFWIYPLYAVMMGDYYSQKNMTSIAQNFYQSVLKISSLKSSPVRLLALERNVNNSIKAIDLRAEKESDPSKFKRKEYENVAKDIEKYIEEYPFSGVSHFLMADLLHKIGRTDESLEHLLASLEMGLPTHDLQRSAEFSLATLLSENQIAGAMKSVLLEKSVQWWGKEGGESILKAGENSLQWLQQQTGGPADGREGRVRYLAVMQDGKFHILLWEGI